MNRRGSIYVAVLVMMIVLVTGFLIWTFLTNSGIVELSVSQTLSLDLISFEKNELELIIFNSGRIAFAKTFEEFSENNLYFDGESFDSLNENFEKDFSDKFRFYFNETIYSVTLKSDEFIFLKNLVSNEEYDFSLRNDGFSILFSDFVLEDDSYDLEVKHIFDLKKDFVFDKLGVDFFKEVFDVVENCKSSSDVESCFNENLEFFDVSVKKVFVESSQKNVLQVYLLSKNYFIFEDGLRKLELGFEVVL